MSWIIYSLLAQFVWAIGNVTDKFVFSKYIKQPIIALLGFGFVGALGAALVYFTKGFVPISIAGLLIALVTGLVYTVANLFYYKAVQAEEISRVIALIYLDPLFTAILSAIFLGEIFSLPKYLGIALLVIGAILISYKKSKGLKLSKGALFCILAVFFYAVFNLLLKYLVDRIDFWTVFAYIRLGSFIALLPLYFFYAKPLIELTKQSKGLLTVTASNVLALVGIIFFTIASSLGYITLVSSLTAIQPFSVLLITLGMSLFYPHILKEEHSKAIFMQKFSAIALIIIGVILITR
jgi:drug/metabolite transporter (DMT)-like permease